MYIFYLTFDFFVIIVVVVIIISTAKKKKKHNMTRECLNKSKYFYRLNHFVFDMKPNKQSLSYICVKLSQTKQQQSSSCAQTMNTSPMMLWVLLWHLGRR